MSKGRARTFLRFFIDSIKGVEYDYTTGNMAKAVLLLSIPMILELSLESVFALVDMYFVGKLGPNAIATVGLTEAVITLVYSFAIGISTAATAIVSRRTGEKNSVEAARSGAQSITLALIVSFVISVFGCVFAEEILGVMQASDELIQQGASFTRLMFAGSASIMLLFLINGIFRGAGNPSIAMKSLWLASALNIVLCPLLINQFGLIGAAMATVAGRTSGVIYQCFKLFGKNSSLFMSRHFFKLDKEIFKSLIQLSWPATLQFIIASGSWIVLAGLVSDAGGTNASAGYQVAIRNVVFFILPAWGVSNAAATLVGQNLGAKQIARAEESVVLTAKINAIFMGAVMLLFLLAADPIISLFTEDAAIQAYGAYALRIIGLGYVFYGIGMVMTQALNGAGDTRTPTLINFFGFWVFQVPLAWWLTKGLALGATGAFIAIPVAETAIACAAWYYFKKGKWKSISV